MKQPAYVMRRIRAAQSASAVRLDRVPDWTHVVRLGGMARWAHVMRRNRGLRGAHGARAVTRGGRCGGRADVEWISPRLCAKKCFGKFGADCSGGTLGNGGGAAKRTLRNSASRSGRRRMVVVCNARNVPAGSSVGVKEIGGGVMKWTSRSPVDRTGCRRVMVICNARNIPASEERRRRPVRLLWGETAIAIRERRWRAARASSLAEIQTQMSRPKGRRVGRQRAQGWKKRVRVERVLAPPFDPERDWHRSSGAHRKFRARGSEERVRLEGVRTLPFDQERVRHRWSGDHRGSSARHVLRLRTGPVLRISRGILCGDWRCG